MLKNIDLQQIPDTFFTALRPYQLLSAETLAALEKMVRIKEMPAGTLYLAAGAQPVFVTFVYQGLFSYYQPFENGDICALRSLSCNCPAAGRQAAAPAYCSLPGYYAYSIKSYPRKRKEKIISTHQT